MRSDYIYPTPLPKEVHCISQNIINAPCSACAYAECMPSLSALSLGLFSTSNRFGLCLRSECHATRAAIKGLTLREITRQKRGSTAVKNNSRGTCQMCAKAVALSKASSYLTKESSLNYQILEVNASARTKLLWRPNGVQNGSYWSPIGSCEPFRTPSGYLGNLVAIRSQELAFTLGKCFLLDGYQVNVENFLECKKCLKAKYSISHPKGFKCTELSI